MRTETMHTETMHNKTRHIDATQVTSRRFIGRAAVAFIISALVVCPTQLALADFAAVGDVTSSVNAAPNPVSEAGGPTGDLIIGDVSTGGLLGDGVAPLFGTLIPLESESVIIGNEPGSIGAVNIEDFIPLGNWTIAGDLIVGNAGLGFLDFLNASTIGDAPTAAIGGTIYVGGHLNENGISSTAPNLHPDSELGSGIVRVNGLGSRLATEVLIVGGEGIGLVEMSGRSLLNTNLETFVGSTQASGDGTITLTDLGTRWSALGPVTVGGLDLGPATSSHGKIVVANQAVFQIDGITSTTNPATLTINPRGRMELEGGTVRMVPLIGNEILNNGLILGEGFIDGGLVIGGTGELRNAAGVANEREYLLVSEAVTNNGTIQSLGGAMEFEALLTNSIGLGGGEIIARDAEMHFRGGVTNSGSISVGGNSTLHGAITMAGGSLVVLSDSESLLVGDLTFTASSVLGLSIGEDGGTLDVTGMADLTGAIFALDYSAAMPSNVGDSYQIFQAGGGIAGAFPGSASADGRLWDIDLVGNTLIATATAFSPLSNGPDFNGDGIVDAADLAIWTNNFGLMGPAGSLDMFGDADMDGDVDGSDYLQILTNFGMPFPISAVSTAVPEPATLVLAMLTLACCPRRRPRA